jgi:hypothetical protein
MSRILPLQSPQKNQEGDTSSGQESQKPRPKKIYPVIPAGQRVVVEVTEAATKPIPPDRQTPNQKKWGVEEKVTFALEVTEGQWEGQKLWKDDFPWFTLDKDKCRLYQDVLALLGEDELPEGFELDLDDLSTFVGRRAVAVISNYTVGKGTPDEKLKHAVEALEPYRTAETPTAEDLW